VVPLVVVDRDPLFESTAPVDPVVHCHHVCRTRKIPQALCLTITERQADPAISDVFEPRPRAVPVLSCSDAALPACIQLAVPLNEVDLFGSPAKAALLSERR